METIVLSGKIRDFKDSHADFEHVVAPEKNIVEPLLGSDKKPVYKGGEGTTTSNAENFSQWFRDVEAVNQSKRLDVVLEDPDGDGIFTYDNSEFFPIDGELFGNEGREHNYHFTYEIHSEFTYQGHEQFKFTGDDDLWVFIDGKLVIDLGGVHPPQSDVIDLKTADEETQLTKALSSGETLVLEKGKAYSFDLFFAERHTSQSHFRIDTSLLLKPAPVVNIQAVDPQATEPRPGEDCPDPGRFVVCASEPVMEDTVVTYTVQGTATEGQDYKTLSRSVTIPAGETEANIDVVPLVDDIDCEGIETVVATLQPGDSYDLGESTTAEVTIAEPTARSKYIYIVVCLVLLLVAVCAIALLRGSA